MNEREFIPDILSQSPFKTKNALVAEITSALAESQNQSDIYYYYLNKEGHLYSSTHKMEVAKSTASSREIDLINQIELWAKNNRKGMALWLSPPQEKGEEAAKMVILELSIHSDRKIIKNQSIVTQFKEEKEINELVALAASLSVNPSFVPSPQETRYHLFILTDPNEAVANLEKFYPDGWVEQKTRIKRAVTITNQKTTGKKIRLFKSYAGDKELSCATNSLLKRLVIFSREIGCRFLECTCPFCHSKVKAEIKNGQIHCPACGRTANYFC